MSELPWNAQVAEETHDQPAETPAGEPGSLALSTDEFAALEERVLRTVNLVKRERLSRAAAEERATQAETKLQEQIPVIEQQKKDAENLQSEVDALHAEREQVRQRVERLLAQFDSLEL